MWKSRTIFLVSLLAFVVIVEAGWHFARIRAFAEGMTAEQFRVAELETLNAWEYPIVGIFLMGMITGLYILLDWWGLWSWIDRKLKSQKP